MTDDIKVEGVVKEDVQLDMFQEVGIPVVVETAAGLLVTQLSLFN